MSRLLPDTFESIRNFIRLNTGLAFSFEKQNDLEYGLLTVALEYGVTDLNDFVEFLLSRPLPDEIKSSLQRNLTIGETYFFREKPVIDKFKALLLQIAPEKRRTTKSLRVWSSGCSSGEEPYSLAITIAETLPDYASWNITLLGTDINNAALHKAQSGIFRKWSFRGVDEHIIQKYFIQTGEQEYEVKPSIKAMVEFSHLNLFEDAFPSPLTKTYSLDFIFCRNVIMYFDPAGRKKVLGGFYNSLNNMGYLFLSLTELAHQTDKRFTTIKDGSVVFYQKDISNGNHPAFNTNYNKISTSNSESFIKKAAPKPYNSTAAPVISAPVTLSDVLTRDNNTTVTQWLQQQSDILRTKNLLTAGELQLVLQNVHTLIKQAYIREALLYISDVLQIEKTCAELFYLKSTLLREKEELTQAEQSLKKALFLEPEYFAALFASGNVQRQMGRNEESKRTFACLISLLQKRSPAEKVRNLDDMSVQELLTISGMALENLAKNT